MSFGISEEEAQLHECDDGNQRDGDGCSSSCKLEHGFECSAGPGEPCVKTERP